VKEITPLGRCQEQPDSLEFFQRADIATGRRRKANQFTSEKRDLQFAILSRSPGAVTRGLGRRLMTLSYNARGTLMNFRGGPKPRLRPTSTVYTYTTRSLWPSTSGFGLVRKPQQDYVKPRAEQFRLYLRESGLNFHVPMRVPRVQPQQYVQGYATPEHTSLKTVRSSG